MSTYFAAINRSKKSVAIDLGSREGTLLVHELVKRSDVVVHNFLPAVAKKLHLDYTLLSTLNPSLIYCSITGYGNDGPLSSKGGYDVIISAMYGLMDITGPATSAVGSKAGVAVTDITTGVLASNAIVSQLFRRERENIAANDNAVNDPTINNGKRGIMGMGKGRGCEIQSSLMETQLSMLANVASSDLNSLEPRNSRYGNAHESIVPYQTFQCSCGGSLVLCGTSDKFYKGIVEALDLRDLTIVVSEQVLSFTLEIADRFLVIEKGRFVIEETRANVDEATISRYLSV